MLTYSIAIRTLGRGGDVFRRELEDIAVQTVQPDKVLIYIYIADGCTRPDFRVGNEEYVWVKKGMMSQRLRHYDQIESDCILMLDDDVSLQPESVAKMLAALEENEVDCVGADTFRTHEMPLSMKIYAALTNLVFPHRDDGWAFKIKTNGSFSYNRKPTSASRRAAPEMPCCGAKIPTTSCISMMNCGSTNSLLLTETTCWSPTRSIRMDTDWGGLYNSGIEHLDARSASRDFRKSPEWIYTRAKAGFLVWWRSCYKTGGDSKSQRFCAALSFFCKSVWLLLLGITAFAISRFSFGMVVSYLKGLRDGWRYAHLDRFKKLGPYII